MTQAQLTQVEKFADVTQRAVAIMELNSFATRGEIFQAALKYFRNSCPQYDAVSYISNRMGISSNSLYRKIADKDVHFDLPEVEAYFRITGYREGFVLWQILTFNLGAK